MRLGRGCLSVASLVGEDPLSMPPSLGVAASPATTTDKRLSLGGRPARRRSPRNTSGPSDSLTERVRSPGSAGQQKTSDGREVVAACWKTVSKIEQEWRTDESACL